MRPPMPPTFLLSARQSPTSAAPDVRRGSAGSAARGRCCPSCKAPQPLVAVGAAKLVDRHQIIRSLGRALGLLYITTEPRCQFREPGGCRAHRPRGRKWPSPKRPNPRGLESGSVPYCHGLAGPRRQWSPETGRRLAGRSRRPGWHLRSSRCSRRMNHSMTRRREGVCCPEKRLRFAPKIDHFRLRFAGAEATGEGRWHCVAESRDGVVCGHFAELMSFIERNPASILGVSDLHHRMTVVHSVVIVPENRRRKSGAHRIFSLVGSGRA